MSRPCKRPPKQTLIKQLLEKEYTQVAAIYGVRVDTLFKWKRYYHIPGFFKNSGSRHHSAKLTEHDVRLIRKLHKEGVTSEELAKKFKVASCTISGITLYYTWKNVRGITT